MVHTPASGYPDTDIATVTTTLMHKHNRNLKKRPEILIPYGFHTKTIYPILFKTSEIMWSQRWVIPS